MSAHVPTLKVSASHDRRHAFASPVVSGGMSLPMIGRLLCHTQVQTTQRYPSLR